MVSVPDPGMDSLRTSLPATSMSSLSPPKRNYATWRIIKQTTLAPSYLESAAVWLSFLLPL